MTTITKNKHTVKRVILLVIGCLLLGYCLLTILPWQPVSYGYNLDESWASAVHIAFRDKIQFGKDFISNYGPYGFLRVANYYFLETYAYAFGFSCLIAIAAWAGLFRLVRYCVSLGNGAVFWLIPLLWFFPNSDLLIDSFQFPLLILPLVLYFYVSKKVTPALVLTLMNASLASLTEHSYFLLAIAFITLITIDEVCHLKRIPRVVSIYLAFTWIFWMFAAQNIANVPTYIANSLEVIKGYSASMGTPGELKEVLFYLFSTGIFLLLVGIIEWINRRWWGILPTLGLATAFFIIFKGAFTRHDSHALQAVFSTTPIMLIFTAVLWTSINKNWRISKKIKLSFFSFLGAVALAMVVMSSLICQNYLGYSYGVYAFKAATHTLNTLPQAAKVLIGREDFVAVAEQARAAVRGANILPPISGTVDLYPNETATVFAYDLEYQPRPTVQSFSAYTSKLARLNAEHLTTADAAENILFDLKPIDGRLASFEDGLSWLKILTRYDIADVENSYLLLKRNSQPRTYNLKPIVEVDVAINEWFDLSDATQPVWGKIDIHPNLIGKLTTAILRLPPINIEIETADGSISSYRTVGDIMDEGFLLSPILSSRWDFMNFAAPSWQDKLASKQVKKFRIVAEGFNARRYSSKYQVNLSQLEFPRQSFAGVRGWQDWTAQIVPIPLEGYLQWVDVDDTGEMGWMAHAPMKMAISLKGTEQKFSVDFGILKQAVTDGLDRQLGDGVKFKIFALQSDGQQKLLFDRDLQPLKNKSDRGTQTVSIDIGKMDISRLILETNEKKDTSFDWSYWSNLQLD